MGLITCPDCGKEVSDRVAACIHCGCPLNESRTSFDIAEIIDEYKKDKLGAIKFLTLNYGLTLAEAKKLVDNEHKNRKLKNLEDRFNDKVNKQSEHFFEHENKKQQLEEDDIHCPKCLSTNLSANRLDWDWLVLDTIDRKKVKITCMDCGHKFKTG